MDYYKQNREVEEARQTNQATRDKKIAAGFFGKGKEQGHQEGVALGRNQVVGELTRLEEVRRMRAAQYQPQAPSGLGGKTLANHQPGSVASMAPKAQPTGITNKALSILQQTNNIGE